MFRTLLVCLVIITCSSAFNQDITLSWPIFAPVIQNLALNYKDQCGQDANRILQSLSNTTYWAVKMADASGNMPSGIIQGNTFNLGDFDSCVENLKAHHCLTKLHFKSSINITTRSIHSVLHPPDAFSPVLRHMQRAGERWRAYRDEATIGICLPTSCNPHQIQTAAEQSLKIHAEKFGGKLQVLDVTCTDKSNILIPYSWGEISFIVVSALIILFSLSGTILDLFSVNGRLVKCFSLKRNMFSLTNKSKNSGNQLLDFIRFISILMIVMSHKLEFTMINPMRNPGYNEMAYLKFELMPMLNPSLVVDTFFFLGGLALAGKLLSESKRGIQTPLWKLYLERYMRLTPPYLLLAFATATILPRIATGPLWNLLVQPESKYCVDNWWTNALYINNYVKPEEMCMMHSWYLPCDMHFYILSAPIVLLLIKKPKIGIALLGSLTILSLIAPFLVIYMRDTDPFIFVYFDFLRSDRNFPYFTDIYVKSHLRATPYLIGVLAGYLSSKLSKTPIKFVKSALLLPMGLVLAGLTALSGAPFYMDPEGAFATSRLIRSLYGAVHRATWSLGLLLIVVAATSLHKLKGNSSNKHDSSQTSGIFRASFPLASLCYCAYLIHVTIVIYSGATIRDPVYNDELLIGLRAYGDTVAAFSFAFVIFIMVEAPARQLTKLLFQRADKGKRQDAVPLEYYHRADDKVLI